MNTVFIAAGSNIEPQQRLRLALAALQQHFGTLNSSAIYQNPTVGFNGPDFLNVVVSFTTQQSVTTVKTTLNGIEELCGRARDAAKYAPRAMDLDLLLYGDLVCNTPTLTLPHRDLLQRAYMLRPMAELAPQLQHPVAHKSFAQLWQAFPQDTHAMSAVTL